ERGRLVVAGPIAEIASRLEQARAAQAVGHPHAPIAHVPHGVVPQGPPPGFAGHVHQSVPVGTPHTPGTPVAPIAPGAPIVRPPAPITLAVVSILMTLLMASIGGIMSTTSSPASTGVALFQVFFSLAFFVVVLVGPAVAANSIASEREGRTWEAVVLTGMRPGEVER